MRIPSELGVAALFALSLFLLNFSPASSRRTRQRIPEDAVAFECDNLGDDVVEKLPVMAHEEKCAGIALQQCLKQFQRLDIEIVGGLIQNQHISWARE